MGEEEPQDSLIVGMDRCCDSACVGGAVVLEEQLEALGLYVQHGGQDGIFVGTTPGLEKPTKADEMAFSGSQPQRLFVARALDGEEPLEHVEVAVHGGIGSEQRARGFAHIVQGVHACEVVQECSLYYAAAEVLLSVHAIAEVVLVVDLRIGRCFDESNGACLSRLIEFGERWRLPAWKEARVWPACVQCSRAGETVKGARLHRRGLTRSRGFGERSKRRSFPDRLSGKNFEVIELEA